MSMMPIPNSEEEILSRILQGQSMQPTTPEDWYSYMGQIYYLIKDEGMQQFLDKDKDLAPLTPTLSHLVRTSNLDPKLREEMKIRWRIACRLQTLILKNPNLVSYSKFMSMVNFGYAAIDDTRDGWRGRLITERIKIMKIEMTPARRKKFLGIF